MNAQTAKTNRISFQGEPGANSDTACRNMFPAMEPLPCPTFRQRPGVTVGRSVCMIGAEASGQQFRHRGR